MRSAIKMLVHARTLLSGEETRHLFTATRVQDQDIKGAVATAREDHKVILLELMCSGKIIPS